ncbi:hypothetical protein V1477_010828 [Vespula maculifrons]|uniref:Uncharacterized protein n=1 Tax=Vespula maculifrons TaxID=7453 RepID=A0ABD2C3T1_VESMC
MGLKEGRLRIAPVWLVTDVYIRSERFVARGVPKRDHKGHRWEKARKGDEPLFSQARFANASDSSNQAWS